MTDTMPIVWEVESQLNRNLSHHEYFDLLRYLHDDPQDTTPEYLIQLFAFTTEETH